jgi:hypothetical protein
VKRKLNRTANAHTSDAGLGQLSNKISGAAYTGGVYTLRLIPGIYESLAEVAYSDIQLGGIRETELQQRGRVRSSNNVLRDMWG